MVSKVMIAVINHVVQFEMRNITEMQWCSVKFSAQHHLNRAGPPITACQVYCN
jgi:hypothetical protein